MPTSAPLSLGFRQTSGAASSSGALQNMWWICNRSGAVLLNSLALIPLRNRR